LVNASIADRVQLATIPISAMFMVGATTWIIMALFQETDLVLIADTVINGVGTREAALPLSAATSILVVRRNGAGAQMKGSIVQ
jgi:hypothetical protein